MEDEDIRRLAVRLTRIYEDGAEMAAAMYAERALAQRDVAASIRWKRIIFAIQQLQKRKPPGMKAVN